MALAHNVGENHLFWCWSNLLSGNFTNAKNYKFLIAITQKHKTLGLSKNELRLALATLQMHFSVKNIFLHVVSSV